jgi:hypothetical protein
MSILNQNTRVDFVGYVPQTLQVNSASQTFASDNVTGMAIGTGAVLGKRFYLNEAQANTLSPNPAVPLFHEGWYRIVQVDTGASAQYVKLGYVGSQKSLALGPDIVTSYDQAFISGCDPVVFLTTVTPGNYTIVQDGGDASVSVLTASGSAGDVVTAVIANNGQAVDPTQSTQLTSVTFASIIGIAQAAWTQAGLVRIRFRPHFGE